MKKKKIIIIILSIVILIGCILTILLIKNNNISIDEVLKKYDYTLVTSQKAGDTYSLGEELPELTAIYQNETYIKNATRIVVTHKNTNEEIKKALEEYYEYYSSINKVDYIKNKKYYYINGYLEEYEQYIYIIGYDDIEVHCLSNDNNKEELDEMFAKIIKHI